MALPRSSRSRTPTSSPRLCTARRSRARTLTLPLRECREPQTTLTLMLTPAGATSPRDLIWDNLNQGDAVRGKNKFFGGILLVLLCGFYTIPLVAVALLANLAALYAEPRSLSPPLTSLTTSLAGLPTSASSTPGLTTTSGSSRHLSVRAFPADAERGQSRLSFSLRVLQVLSRLSLRFCCRWSSP